MSHHRRGRPKNRRAGCLMCKPWRVNGLKREKRAKYSDRKRLYEVLSKMQEHSRRGVVREEPGSK